MKSVAVASNVDSKCYTAYLVEIFNYHQEKQNTEKKRKGKNETKSTNNETEEKLFKVKTAKSHSTRRKDNIELKPSMKNRTLYLLENRNKKKIGCMVKEEKKKVNNLSRPLK